MNRFLALTFVFAAAAAAPQTLLPAGTFAAGHLGHLGAVAHAAPVAVAHAAAPVAVPAPYTTSSQAAGVTTVHQPEPVVTKEVHYGQTSYISGYNTAIHKPPTPVHVDAPYEVPYPVAVAGEPIIKHSVAP